MIDTGDIDVFLGLDVGKGEHHATAVTPTGKKGVRQAAAPHRTQAPRTVRETPGQTRDRAGRGRPAGLDRRPAAGGRPRHGLPGRLSARADDAADRRPLPRRGQDAREKRVHHRRRGPRDAPHAAGDRRRGRDDRRTGDDRRVRRRPGRRGGPAHRSLHRPGPVCSHGRRARTVAPRVVTRCGCSRTPMGPRNRPNTYRCGDTARFVSERSSSWTAVSELADTGSWPAWVSVGPLCAYARCRRTAESGRHTRRRSTRVQLDGQWRGREHRGVRADDDADE